MIVRMSTPKPQKVNACAAPGNAQRSSLRCPTTSSSSSLARLALCANRPVAGLPEVTSRKMCERREPAIASATAVAAKPIGYLVSTRPPAGQAWRSRKFSK